MKKIPTDVAGAWIIENHTHKDARGSFMRVYCRDTFQELGIDVEPSQISLSFNSYRGTLRGLHAQDVPHEEAKLVTCTSGLLFDVVVDLRENSPTYGRWSATTLTAGDGRAFFIPKGCAHGFQTLESNTTVLYQITSPFSPEARIGVRWNDDMLAIAWPLAPTLISDADKLLPDWQAFTDARQSSLNK